MPKKFFLILVVLVIAVISATAAGFIYFKNRSTEPVACTMEAKLCPDGSYVSRQGPSCEFTKCPDIVKSESGTVKINQVVTIQNVSFTPLMFGIASIYIGDKN